MAALCSCARRGNNREVFPGDLRAVSRSASLSIRLDGFNLADGRKMLFARSTGKDYV